MIGIVGVSFWKDEKVMSMTPGESFTVGGYRREVPGERPLFGPNFTGIDGRVRGQPRTAAARTGAPEKREFLPSRQPTTEVALCTARLATSTW